MDGPCLMKQRIKAELIGPNVKLGGQVHHRGSRGGVGGTQEMKKISNQVVSKCTRYSQVTIGAQLL